MNVIKRVETCLEQIDVNKYTKKRKRDAEESKSSSLINHSSKHRREKSKKLQNMVVEDGYKKPNIPVDTSHKQLLYPSKREC